MPPLIATIRRWLEPYQTDAGRAAGRTLVLLSLLVAVTQFVSVTRVFLLTRGLGSDLFGVFAVGLALRGYLSAVGVFGVNRVMIRDGARNPALLDVVATSYFVITSAASLTLFALVVVATAWAPLKHSERLMIWLLAAGNVADCVNLRSLFDIHHRQARSAAITACCEVAGLALIIAAYLTERLSLPLVGGIYAGQWTAACIGQYLVYHRTVKRWRWSFSAEHIRQSLNSSWPLVLSGVIAVLPMTSGVFFVRWWHDNTDAAILGLAQQISGAYAMCAMSATTILQPHIAGQYGMTGGFFKKLVGFFIAFHAALFALAALGTTVLIVMFLEPVYYAAIVPTLILLVGRVLNSAQGIGGMYAITRSLERLLLVVNGTRATLFVVGCVLLVPYGSYLASVCLSTLAAACGLTLIIWIVGRRIVEEKSISPPESSRGQ